MTKRQADKLGTIIAKLEALQAELSAEESSAINHAKSPLIRMWQRFSR